MIASRVDFNRLVLGGLTGAFLGAALLLWKPSAMADMVAVCSQKAPAVTIMAKANIRKCYSV